MPDRATREKSPCTRYVVQKLETLPWDSFGLLTVPEHTAFVTVCSYRPNVIPSQTPRLYLRSDRPDGFALCTRIVPGSSKCFHRERAFWGASPDGCLTEISFRTPRRLPTGALSQFARGFGYTPTSPGGLTFLCAQHCSAGKGRLSACCLPQNPGHGRFIREARRRAS